MGIIIPTYMIWQTWFRLWILNRPQWFKMTIESLKIFTSTQVMWTGTATNPHLPASPLCTSNQSKAVERSHAVLFRCRLECLVWWWLSSSHSSMPCLNFLLTLTHTGLILRRYRLLQNAMCPHLLWPNVPHLSPTCHLKFIIGCVRSWREQGFPKQCLHEWPLTGLR